MVSKRPRDILLHDHLRFHDLLSVTKDVSEVPKDDLITATDLKIVPPDEVLLRSRSP